MMFETLVKNCASGMAALAMLSPLQASADVNSVSLKIVNPSQLYDPAPNGYSHAVVASQAKKIAYLAGQGGEDRNGVLSPEFSDQVRMAYANLKIALDAVGAMPNQVTKITTYVVGYDQSMLGVMTKYVKDTFGDTLPAQTLVPVPRLALDGMLFEVDAIAVMD